MMSSHRPAGAPQLAVRVPPERRQLASDRRKPRPAARSQCQPSARWRQPPASRRSRPEPGTPPQTQPVRRSAQRGRVASTRLRTAEPRSSATGDDRPPPRRSRRRCESAARQEQTGRRAPSCRTPPPARRRTSKGRRRRRSATGSPPPMAEVTSTRAAAVSTGKNGAASMTPMNGAGVRSSHRATDGWTMRSQPAASGQGNSRIWPQSNSTQRTRTCTCFADRFLVDLKLASSV